MSKEEDCQRKKIENETKTNGENENEEVVPGDERVENVVLNEGNTEQQKFYQQIETRLNKFEEKLEKKCK